MEKFSFISLAKADICITDISCVEYQWNNYRKNEYPTGRNLNVLSFSTSGKRCLRMLGEDRSFDVQGASVLFIAQGTPYMYEAFPEDDGTPSYTACIKFRLTDKSGEDVLVSDEAMCWDNINKVFFMHLFKKVITEYVSANTNCLAVKSTFYKLISELVVSMQVQKHSHDGFEDLVPAISYLENHLGSNMTVGELAKMCFISTSHFTKRFKEYSGGMTLTDYRNKMRVEKAKELLESPMWPTALIAETLGFYDISHLCKIYKKYTGESLSDFKRSLDVEYIQK